MSSVAGNGETAAPLRAFRILLAGENADMRQVVGRLLGDTYDVHAVGDGKAALAAVRDDAPDLVIADTMLPLLDGGGLLLALRADPRTRNIPVILLARAGEETQAGGVEAGATDYLVEPFSARELLTRVSTRLEIARLNREAFGREREVRRAIVEGMADTFYAIDAEWRVTDFNAHAAPQLRKLGKDPAHFIGKNVWEEFTDSPAEEVFRQVMRDRVPITHEHYYAPLDEWVENRIYPSPDGGIAVFQRYITDRKRLDEKRRRRETYLAQAQALTHTGSWALNPRTGELFWSAEHFRIFGLDPTDGPPTVEAAVRCIHPEDRPLADETFARALAERGSYSMDLRIVRPDGEVRHVRSIGQPVLDASGDLVDYVGTIIDMTELQRADEALHHAQTALAHVTRVTTMGELVASLAHELNQPLAAIVTNGGASLRFLGRPSPEVDKAMAAISCMIQDAERAGEVMAGTRAFLKKSSGERIRLDINRKIRDVLVVIRPEIRKQRVVLHEFLASDLPPVHGVRVQIQQVVLNLTMNAIEAMASVTDRRRELIIRSARHDVDGTPGVLVSVQDSGIGVVHADLGRLFDAFYTTKPDGLGMGLSISRSAIEAHGGHLWATPNVTVGATFQFIIPVQSEPTP